MLNCNEHHYAVIFVAHKRALTEEYKKMSAFLNDEVEKAEGFLGQHHVGDMTTITVSYWQDLESIRKWRRHSEHLVAQRLGIEEWYEWYDIQVCKVERAYSYERTRGSIQA